MFCEPKKKKSKQLKGTKAKKEPAGGWYIEFVYGAYVFFEELRVWDGKPKTKKRSDHGGVGVVPIGIEGPCVCTASSVLLNDEFSRVHTI